MHRKIVVAGSSNTDMIVKTPRIPGPGETILGGVFSMAAGGKGANQAVAAARAGGKVAFIACVGRDLFGDKALEGLSRDGIDISCVVRHETAPSGVALIIVNDDGENSIAVAPGANGNLLPSDLERFRSVIESASILVIQLEIPLESVKAAVEIASRNGVTVILNPAPAAPVPPEILRRVDFLTPNEHETRVLTGIEVGDESTARSAAATLADQGVKTVIITMGSRGAYVAGGVHEELVPGFSVRAVDTTGAGDVFNGSLAVALAEGSPLRDAVRFANAAAALSVTRLGAQPSIPVRKEIDRFLLADH
jgi:ribokinase